MIYSAIITFGASAIQITDTTNGVTTWPAGCFMRKLLIEPLRGNGAACYWGLSTVTNNGTGAAIQELAAPAAGIPLDRVVHVVHSDLRSEDPSVYYVHGTSGQKCKVTIWGY